MASLDVHRSCQLLEHSLESREGCAPAYAQRFSSSAHDSDLPLDLDEAFEKARQDDGRSLMQHESSIEQEHEGEEGAEKGEHQAWELREIGIYASESSNPARIGHGNAPETP